MSTFAEQVQDALARLYDPVYLQTHPLIRNLPPAVSGGPAGPLARTGVRLRAQLEEAIETLKPAGDGATRRGERGHLILRLRYVDALDPVTIQSRLGLGKSTYYVEHKRAVDAVTSVLAQRWGAAISSPAPRSAPGPILPEVLTSFIGRDWELAALRGMLSPDAGTDGARVVTLTGPAGIGKTRLALQVAAAIGSDHSMTAQLVELAPINDAARVLPAIASRLGIREAAGTTVMHQLIDHLAGSRSLLVLDNFEQVIGAAVYVGELLAACPGVRALVTSREALRIAGEWEFPVPPLQVPGQTLAAARALTPIAQYEAVRLFVDRARAIDPKFAVTDENGPAVVEICQRVDGLPLAIELAAARTRALTPGEILPRLERRLSVLTGGARNLPSRQQTLRGAIAWSYDLLDDSERKLFQRLSAFIGGTTVEAVEEVCGDGALDDAQRATMDAIDVLESLLVKNLIRRTANSAGEARLTMLEVIREYAAEQLEGIGAHRRCRAAHAAYYLRFVERAAERLLSAEQAVWLQRLDAEQGNAHAALKWFVEAGASEAALRLTGALRHYWTLRGRWKDGLDWLAQALSLAAPVPPDAPDGATPERARALHAAGHLAGLRGDNDAARRWCEQSLALWRALRDEVGCAACLYGLANTYLATGERDRSRKLYEEALALYRRLGDDERIASALAQLGLLAEMDGRYDDALELQQQSLAIRRRLADRSGLANALNNLGNLARARRAPDEAIRFYGEALALCHELGHRLGEATTSLNLALVHIARGECDASAPLLAEATELYADLGHRRGLAWCVPGYASLFAARGSDERAVALFGAAAVLLDACGAPLSPAERDQYDRTFERARARLPVATAGVALEAGRAMTLEQALEFARG